MCYIIVCLAMVLSSSWKRDAWCWELYLSQREHQSLIFFQDGRVQASPQAQVVGEQRGNERPWSILLCPTRQELEFGCLCHCAFINQ